MFYKENKKFINSLINITIIYNIYLYDKNYNIFYKINVFINVH